MTQKSRFRSGFTVLELLVVIAIIAILAALLLPGLSRAKAKAQRTTCISDIRQINLGLRMYSDDSSDYSPKTPHTNNFPSLANLVDFTGYKEVMKRNVGLSGASSARDKVFACPADQFTTIWFLAIKDRYLKACMKTTVHRFFKVRINGEQGKDQVSGVRAPSIGWKKIFSRRIQLEP